MPTINITFGVFNGTLIYLWAHLFLIFGSFDPPYSDLDIYCFTSFLKFSGKYLIQHILLYINLHLNVYFGHFGGKIAPKSQN